MAPTRVSSLVGYAGLPEHVRVLSPLADADYADLFVVPVDGARSKSPRQWLLDSFAGAPAWVRMLVPVAHRQVLGLRVEPASLHAPIGWAVAAEEPDWIRLEASGRLFAANLIGLVDDSHLSLATFIRYRSPASKLIWEPVSVLHRYVARTLMGRVAASQARSVDNHHR